MAGLTDALRQFDATEANLKKLDELWAAAEKLIPSGMVIDTSSPDAIHYADLCRTFAHIRSALPKVDGIELSYEMMDWDAIFNNRFDAMELGEPSFEISIERQIYKQGEKLHEYRFLFEAQRRALVRNAMVDAIRAVDEHLVEMEPDEDQEGNAEVTHASWPLFKQRIAEIDVLKGTAIKSPPRWSDLHRHMHFGLVGDLRDIISHDWPAAKPALEAALYGANDPIPVAVADLAALVRTAPTGKVVTALKWDSIDANAFERLVFNLVSQAPGYANAQWPTHTNAPDRGRDLSVERIVHDVLNGQQVLRVIVQCKHWLHKTISIDEITKLLNQMELWEPPKVDELIIATTGRFSTDAVDWVERHNTKRAMPRIAMWADSHLESLLAGRPHLVSEFRLR